MAEHLEFWPVFEPVIAPLLGEEDDPTLWPVVLDAVSAAHDEMVVYRLPVLVSHGSPRLRGNRRGVIDR